MKGTFFRKRNLPFTLWTFIPLFRHTASYLPKAITRQVFLYKIYSGPSYGRQSKNLKNTLNINSLLVTLYTKSNRLVPVSNNAFRRFGPGPLGNFRRYGRTRFGYSFYPCGGVLVSLRFHWLIDCYRCFS